MKCVTCGQNKLFNPNTWAQDGWLVTIPIARWPNSTQNAAKLDKPKTCPSCVSKIYSININGEIL